MTLTDSVKGTLIDGRYRVAVTDETNRWVIPLAKILTHRGILLVTAESCTGGGIAEALTSVPGSSRWFDRGFVTYSNAAKIDMLGVEPSLIAHWGAVSEPVVAAMVGGALDRSQADLAVAVTGIAGPTGGTPDKPIGTVWFGLAHRPYPVHTFCRYFEGGRQAVRQQAVVTAIGALIQLLDDEEGVLS